jgi:hypothetical protein
MKEQTPMQELEMKLSAAVSGDLKSDFECGMKHAYEIILTEVQGFLLEKEKKSITDAYTYSQKQVIEIIQDVLPTPKTLNNLNKVLLGEEKNEDAENYFNNKYNIK